MMNCPRYFGFCGVPYYEGKPLLVASNASQYIFYCSWLVEFLGKIPHDFVPECQRDLCAELEQSDPVLAVSCLGENAFYHLDTYETLERYIEDDISYEEAEKDLRVKWEKIWQDYEPDEILAFVEYINPTFWEHAKREYVEKRAMVFPVRHLDVGYRVPLARILAKVPSREERLKLIERFYDAFNEESSK